MIDETSTPSLRAHPLEHSLCELDEVGNEVYYYACFAVTLAHCCSWVESRVLRIIRDID